MNTRLAALVDDLYLFKMKYFQMPTSSNYHTSVKFKELILTQAIWIGHNYYLVVLTGLISNFWEDVERLVNL